MSEFAVRALEIHSQYAWDYEWVTKALRFMQQRGLNTLVLHRNDLLQMKMTITDGVLGAVLFGGLLLKRNPMKRLMGGVN